MTKFGSDIQVVADGGDASGYLSDGIKNIQLLGSDEEIAWERSEDGLLVNLPAIPVGAHAFTLKITPN